MSSLNVAYFTPTYCGAMRELERIAADPTAVFYGAYGEAIEIVAAIYDRPVDVVVCDIQTWRAAKAVPTAREGESTKALHGEPYASNFGRFVR